MNKQNYRCKQIITLLKREGSVSTKELSKVLNTSEITIRRDLNILEEQGFLIRKHGGAILSELPSMESKYSWLFGKEIGVNVKEKSLIARKATSLISPNETVAFDMGTTTYFIAHYLKRDISFTAICTSYNCLSELYNKPNVNVMTVGGLLYRETNAFSSEEGFQLLKKQRSDKVFISAGGIHSELGLTVHYDYQVVIKKILMESSKRIIVVADSSKFDQITTLHFADLKEIHTIITDYNISPEYVDKIKTLGIELIICDDI